MKKSRIESVSMDKPLLMVTNKESEISIQD
jgi:hypothetical protein